MQEHGGDIYSNEGLVDFSANINPLGPGEKVMKALKKSLENVTAYPDPKCRALREAVAKREATVPEHIICGNGAADLIYTMVLAEKPKRALLCTPSFSEYEKALRTVDCQIRFHERKVCPDTTVSGRTDRGFGYDIFMFAGQSDRAVRGRILTSGDCGNM